MTLLGCEMWSVLRVTVSEQWKLVMQMDTGKGNELPLTSFGVTCPGLRTVKVDIYSNNQLYTQTSERLLKLLVLKPFNQNTFWTFVCNTWGLNNCIYKRDLF